MNCNEKIEEFKANLPSVFKTNNQQLQVLIGKLNCSRPFEEQQKIIRKVCNKLFKNLTLAIRAIILF